MPFLMHTTGMEELTRREVPRRTLTTFIHDTSISFILPSIHSTSPLPSDGLCSRPKSLFSDQRSLLHVHALGGSVRTLRITASLRLASAVGQILVYCQCAFASVQNLCCIQCCFYKMSGWASIPFCRFSDFECNSNLGIRHCLEREFVRGGALSAIWTRKPGWIRMTWVSVKANLRGEGESLPFLGCSAVCYIIACLALEYSPVIVVNSVRNCGGSIFWTISSLRWNQELRGRDLYRGTLRRQCFLIEGNEPDALL